MSTGETGQQRQGGGKGCLLSSPLIQMELADKLSSATGALVCVGVCVSVYVCLCVQDSPSHSVSLKYVHSN